jgi:molybdopterin converting factor small subunit
MKIDVKLGEPFWRQIGQKQISLELHTGALVQDLINELVVLYPALQDYLSKEEVPPIVVLKDEIVEMDTSLHEGDRPTLMWAISGG